MRGNKLCALERSRASVRVRALVRAALTSDPNRTAIRPTRAAVRRAIVDADREQLSASTLPPAGLCRHKGAWDDLSNLGFGSGSCETKTDDLHEKNSTDLAADMTRIRKVVAPHVHWLCPESPVTTRNKSQSEFEY